MKVCRSPPQGRTSTARRSSCSVVTPLVFQTNAVLAGRYLVQRELGKGGQGVVLVAKDVTRGDLVALKMMHPDHVWNDELRARFMREARAASRLASPHVARLRDSGVIDGLFYIAFEFLPGMSLDR